MLKADRFRDLLARLNITAARIEDMQFAAAELDIDIGTMRQVVANLKQLGWTRHATGKYRLWLAPGVLPGELGISAAKNKPFLVRKAILELTSGLDEIPTKTLIDAVRQLSGVDEPSKTIITYMNRNGWYLHKQLDEHRQHNNLWRRVPSKDAIQ